MTESELGDVAARTLVREALDRTLFVEAGAGSGKTSELVQRVLALVTSGRAPIRAIAAITFTEAAAAELRFRIHGALAERLTTQPDDVRVRDALDTLDEAAITTIHGFARRVLAEFPLEAGLPLRLRIVDEVEDARRREARFVALLDELATQPSERELTATFLSLGVTTHALRDLHRKIDERFDAVSAQVRSRMPRHLDELSPLVVSACRELLPLLVGLQRHLEECSMEDDRLRRELRRLTEHAALFPDHGALDERLEWLRRLAPSRTPRPMLDAWGAEEKKAAQEAHAALRSRYEEVISPIGELVSRLILERLSLECDQAAGQRARAGELAFHDLLVLALRLLRDNAEVRERLRDRYRVVLVDEFQDTDPAQLALVRELTDGEVGRVFFVGDPKQSIYRFRGAELELYRRAYAAVGPDDALVLSSNFRSVPGIVEFVNASLAFVLEGSEDAARVEAARLIATRDRVGDVPPVVVLGGPSPPGERAAQRRVREAEDIALAIETAVVEGWLVDDATSGTPRPATLGDIAILVPRRTGLPSLERALAKRRIAYRIESPTLLYQTAQVRDLLAVLTALAHPGEETTIVAALRGGVLGCSDEELLSYRRAGGEWRIAGELAASDPVGASLAYLHSLERRRYGLSLAGLVALIVEERALRQLAATGEEPEELERRIEFVFSELAAFEETGESDLISFVAWARRRAEVGRRGGEAVSTQHKVDAVRVLTIHGAKGLEFPIVVLAELGGALASAPRPPELLVEEGRAEVRLGRGLETAGFSELSVTARDRDAQEGRRLGYVGATRARDHLVLCLHHPTTKNGASSLAREFHLCAHEHPGLVRTIAASRDPMDRASTVASTHSRIDAAEYETWCVTRDALVRRANADRSLAASSLGEEQPLLGALAAHLFDEDDAPIDPLVVSRRRDASAIGRATHAALERVDLASGEGLDEAAAAACTKEHCEGDAARVAALAEAGRTSALVREAVAASRRWRELPLSIAIAGGVLEGIVDLCFEESDGSLVVVDYKTDEVRDLATAEERAQRYELQLGAYALGLSRLTGRHVARCELLFLAAPHGPIAVRLRDVDSLVERASEELVARFVPAA